MPEVTEVNDATEVRSLETQVRALQMQLLQREDLLKTLNRRLLQLERGDITYVGGGGDLLVENLELTRQLDSLQNTKLYRWSTPARGVYARLRRPR